MTTKEIAEAAGVSADTVQRKIKELFPDRVQERRRTELNQSQAIRVMAELRKKDFMSLPQNAVDAPQNAEDRITRLETLVAAQIGMVEKLIYLVAKNGTDAKNALAQIEAPPLATRDELRRIVAKAGRASGDYPGTWSLLYQEIYYRIHRNVRECAKNRRIDTLDYIESEGLLPEAIAIAREVFR